MARSRAPVSIAILLSTASVLAAAADDWRQDWAIAPGFELTIDTQGFDLPTDIAFVRNPGPAPDHPLYFVAELRGAIKVVTNDRSVHRFAEVPAYRPDPVLAWQDNLAGLAGLDIDPASGDLFATYASQDDEGVLRNHVVRFAREPLALESTDVTHFDGPISTALSGRSHQIGDCRVADDSLYVAVGDGGVPEASTDLEPLVGKILRLTLDGAPHPDNPLRDKPGEGAPHVWAYGLRNPFGIDVVSGDVFAAESGTTFDRFLRLAEGRNYGWDGADWNIGVGADAVFSPEVGAVRVVYLPPESEILDPRHRDRFYVVASDRERGGLISLRYDFARGVVSETPEYVVAYRGADEFALTGAAIGPDGLYLTPFPLREEQTPVLKLSWNPVGDYPNRLGTAKDLIDRAGCHSCHYYSGGGALWGSSLDADGMEGILRRIESDSYVARLAELDGIGEEPWLSTREARREVSRADGPDRLRTYLTHKILEPRFDNTSSWMPKHGFDAGEAAAIADYLLIEAGRGPATEGVVRRVGMKVRSWIPLPPSRAGDIAAGALLGFAGLLGGLFLIRLAAARRRRPR